MNLNAKINEFLCNDSIRASINTSLYKINEIDKINKIEKILYDKLKGNVLSINTQNDDNFKSNSSKLICQASLLGYGKCCTSSSFSHDYNRNEISLCWKHSYLLSLE